ncbi:MAG TPA: hypothetical protein VHO69_04355, partial [Phototrophicaceae bacterium]|nr:hypothetical protein [Phototrophicaceae bacterium]
MTLLWWLTLLIVGLVASCVLMAVVVLISMKIYELQHPAPPGYANFLESSAWDAASIGDFLGVFLPSDAQDVQIEGSKGYMDVGGTKPGLKFRFRSSPQTA